MTKDEKANISQKLLQMPIHLPRFDEPWLRRLLVCCIIESTPEDSRAQSQRDEILETRTKDGLLIRLVLGVREKTEQCPLRLHFHIEVHREASSLKTARQITFDQFVDMCAKYFGEATNAWMRGFFTIPKDRVSKSRIVSSMTGIPIEIDGTKISITGASMSIAGKEFKSLEWKVTDSGDVTAEIEGPKSLVIDDKLLLEAERHLQSGFNRFVASSETGAE